MKKITQVLCALTSFTGNKFPHIALPINTNVGQQLT